MTLQEKLLAGEELLSSIERAAEETNYERCFQLLDSPQPDQWLSSKKSDITSNYYFFNEAELIEAIMKRLFIFNFEIEPPVFVQMPPLTSVTIVGKLYYYFKKDKAQKVFYTSGIATETVEPLAALKLASPACKTNAFKSACAFIGELLGNGINRTENGIEPEAPVDKLRKSLQAKK